MVELQESSGCFYKKRLFAAWESELRRDGKKKEWMRWRCCLALLQHRKACVLGGSVGHCLGVHILSDGS